RRHTRSKRDWSSDVCSSDLKFSFITYIKRLLHHLYGEKLASHPIQMKSQLSFTYLKPCSPRNCTRSTQREEYPISLSYHETTFTILSSMTIVDKPSTIEECGLPTMSLDTSGSSEYSIIPFNSLSAAFLNAAFTSSSVTFLSISATRSVTEPSGTGTRTAIPFNLPFSSGNTFPTAFAAPVDVGIIFSAAARERR